MYEDSLQIEGYTFSRYVYDNYFNSGLLATKEVIAEDFNKAYQNFALNLVPLLNAMSVVTQCAIESMGVGSQYIYRLNNNSDRIAHLYVASRREPTGMDINPNNKGDIHLLQDEKLRTGLGFFREANNAGSPKTRLSMLLAAAEAFAGEEITKKTCPKCGAETTSYPTTSKSGLEKVLTKNLYTEIYNKKRIRQHLFHGGKVDDSVVIEYANKVHEQLLFGYLQPTYALADPHKIIGAPRNASSFEYSGSFIKLDSHVALLPSLQSLEEEWDSPDNYEFCGEPAGY